MGNGVARGGATQSLENADFREDFFYRINRIGRMDRMQSGASREEVDVVDERTVSGRSSLDF
jgi:hypothetical protein